MKEYQKHLLLLPVLLVLFFSRPIFVFLRVPVSLYEPIIFIVIVAIAIYIFFLLEKFTRSFFLVEKKKDPTSPLKDTSENPLPEERK